MEEELSQRKTSILELKDDAGCFWKLRKDGDGYGSSDGEDDGDGDGDCDGDDFGSCNVGNCNVESTLGKPAVPKSAVF